MTTPAADTSAARRRAGDRARRGLRERAFVPVLGFIGMVVSIVSSLGAPLIPSIASDLHASLSSAQWSLTVTLLVGAVASPIVGRLGDGARRRALILVCLAAVTAGGVLAAVAGTLPLLIAGRALQGMGLALIPLTMAAARDRLGEREAGPAIAMLSVVTAVGVGLGYPITGLIADHADLAAAFWFGAAVTGAALVLAALVLPGAGDVAGHRRLDVPGAAIITIGLVGLLIGLEKGPDWGWGSTGTLVLLAIAVVFLAAWVLHELSTSDPLVDLRLVRHRAVLTANLGGVIVGVAMYMVITLMTDLVQLPSAGSFGFDASVFLAGLTLVPLSVCSFLASRALPPFQRRVGVRPIIPLGSVAFALGALFFALTARQMWEAFVTMGIVGLGLGFTFAAMPGLIVSATPRSETGSAMGFYQVARYIGFSVGSGLSITLLRAFGTHGEPTLGSYRVAFVSAATIAVVAAVLAWVVPGAVGGGPPDPAERTELERLEMEEGVIGAAGLEMLDDRPRRPS